MAATTGSIEHSGVATRNGLMMISHIETLMRAEGVTDVVEAVKR